MKISGKMIKYKLTDQQNYTRRGEKNETLWEPGRMNRAAGNGASLCTEDVIHFYDTPLIAAFMNPVHANFDSPGCWEIEVDGVVAHDGTKGGTKIATAIKPLPLPVITREQVVRFAIFCALEVYKEPTFVVWAEKWLSGVDRSQLAARAARARAEARAVAEAAWTAAWAVAEAAAAGPWAAEVAVRAAEAVAVAARAKYFNLHILALRAME